MHAVSGFLSACFYLGHKTHTQTHAHTHNMHLNMHTNTGSFGPLWAM